MQTNATETPHSSVIPIWVQVAGFKILVCIKGFWVDIPRSLSIMQYENRNMHINVRKNLTFQQLHCKSNKVRLKMLSEPILLHTPRHRVARSLVGMYEIWEREHPCPNDFSPWVSPEIPEAALLAILHSLLGNDKLLVSSEMFTKPSHIP